MSRSTPLVGSLFSLLLASPVAAQLVAPPGPAFPNGLPDLCASPTVVSTKSGPWSAATTWSPVRVPTSGDRVRVSVGHSVSYDVSSTARLSCIGIGGELKASQSVSTKLVVGTIIGYSNSAFDWGTPTRVVTKAEVVFADMPVTDADQFGIGGIFLGTFSAHGPPKTSYVRLTAGVASNQTNVTSSTTPAGWSSQDLLTLPDTRQVDRAWQPSRPTLQTISGASITMTGTALARPMPKSLDGTVTAPPHLGNLSRGVVFRSENPNGTRGYLMAALNAVVDLRYVEFADLGRTRWDVYVSSQNVAGRYGVHLHHLNTKPTVASSSFRDIRKWPITIHNTNFGLFTDNVIVSGGGAAIMTESGAEYGNIIARNLIVGSPGTGSTDSAGRGGAEFGYEGSGIWLSSPTNIVEDNFVYETTLAYTIYPHDARQMQTPEGLKDMNCVPVKSFKRNTAVSSYFALQLWDVGARSATWTCEVGGESLIEDFTAFHTWKRGVFNYPTNRVTFLRMRLFNDPAQVWSNPAAMDWGDYSQRNVKILSSRIEGFRTCVAVPNKMGDVRDRYGYVATPMLVQDTALDCQTGVGMGTQWGVVGGGASMVPRTVELRNVSFPGRMPGAGIRIGTSAATIQQAQNSGGPRFNWIVLERLLVFGYNGVAGDDFQLFQKEQAPTFITPHSFDRHVGSPEAGQSNLQNLNEYGVTLGGELARCSTERVGLYGYACSQDGSVPPPPPPPSTVTKCSVNGPLKLCATFTTGQPYTVKATVDVSSNDVHSAKLDGVGWGSLGLQCSGSLCEFSRAYSAGFRTHRLTAEHSNTSPWPDAVLVIP
jgi:hypothetical protein